MAQRPAHSPSFHAWDVSGYGEKEHEDGDPAIGKGLCAGWQETVTPYRFSGWRNLPNCRLTRTNGFSDVNTY